MRKLKNENEAVSPVIGVILMVAITVVLATIVFVLVQNLSKTQEQAPTVSFQKNETGITVIQAPNNMAWSDISVSGCDTYPTIGNVAAGDEVTDCAGTVKIIHGPSNALLYDTTF